MSEPYVVGVTGGIGSGKTTITNQFLRLGIDIVDADECARAVVQPNSPLLHDIRAAFGADVFHPNGELDRAALRALIFSDENAKLTLNGIMHPAIRKELLAQIAQATSPYVILSAPLLLENNLDRLCDRVLVIDVPESVQVERTIARDHVPESQVRAIMAAQISRKSRLARADDIIDNTQPVSALVELVASLHQQYLGFAKSK
ncbi:dephospho-CoA kinase [Aliidiomarina halalkaliphila]|uniref:dephospho-CoA kinase n=1 Tax=Aliidiomarina halalkaliphila TaxID=2593535 RepID=UPI0038B9CFC7